jgi:hypothetical protein
MFMRHLLERVDLHASRYSSNELARPGLYATVRREAQRHMLLYLALVLMQCSDTAPHSNFDSNIKVAWCMHMLTNHLHLQNGSTELQLFCSIKLTDLCDGTAIHSNFKFKN